MKEIGEVDLAWLAGILEGEGSFMAQHVPADGHQGPRIRVRVSLSMTDEDVVARVCDIVGLGRVRPAKGQRAHYKDLYAWTITAMDPVAALLRLLRPYMGERRRRQIDACLAAVVEATPTRRKRNHGLTKYGDGCRCDICRQAKREKNSRRKNRLDGR